MSSLMRRPANLILLLAISVWLALSSFSLLALAQEPAPFEIRVIPQAEYAVAGQPFTYTVVVTNVGQTSLENVFINVDVPDGAKFINTDHSNIKWYGGVPYSDPEIKRDQITLFTPEAIEAGEVFSFTMIVEILPETKGEISIETYNAINFENDILASGSPVKTQVRISAPTPPPPTPTLPVPTPSVTPMPTQDIIASSSAGAKKESDSKLPTLTPEASTVVSQPQSLSNSQEVTSVSIFIIATVGLLLILALIGVFWVLKRK